MIIWGINRSVQQLAILMLVCWQCSNPAAHGLRRRVTTFTLYFVPIFDVAKHDFVECTFCGVQSGLTREEAQELLAQAQAFAAQAPTASAA